MDRDGIGSGGGNNLGAILDDELIGSSGVSIALDGGAVDHAVGVEVEQLFVIVRGEVDHPYHLVIHHQFLVHDGEGESLLVPFCVEQSLHTDLADDPVSELGEGSGLLIRQRVPFIVVSLIDYRECSIFMTRRRHDTVNLECVVAGNQQRWVQESKQNFILC